MMFDKLCIEKILNGEKTVTRRVKRNNRKPAIPGTIHKLKIDRTPKVYGYIKILSCTIEEHILNVGDDYIKEGFVDKQEFFDYWLNVNFPYCSDPIWRVEFELVDGDDQ